MNALAIIQGLIVGLLIVIFFICAALWDKRGQKQREKQIEEDLKEINLRPSTESDSVGEVRPRQVYGLRRS